jgi:ATP-dependent helicase HrpA
LIRFELAALPAHLTAHLTVTQDGRAIARGTDLVQLRRQCAAAARAELDRQARAAYPLFGNWRKFELDELPERVPLALDEGTIWVYPTLLQRESSLQPHYEWSAEEAQRTWRQGAVRLARAMLERQSRDLAKAVGGNIALLLSAGSYVKSDALVDTLLQVAFRNACFAEGEPPRTRAAFTAAVDQGRERLYSCLDEITAMVSDWLKQAAVVRQALEDARVELLAEPAEETRGHLRRLFDHRILQSVSMEWLRQLPRYLKAEQRRWQRNPVRGGEPKTIGAELKNWSALHHELEQQLEAELRWTPKLDELRFWIEEYRVSLYAQELRTLGPVSAARLRERATEIEAWLRR